MRLQAIDIAGRRREFHDLGTGPAVVMVHGGQPRPLPWYRRIFRSRASKTVMLTAPVPIRIVP